MSYFLDCMRSEDDYELQGFLLKLGVSPVNFEAFSEVLAVARGLLDQGVEYSQLEAALFANARSERYLSPNACINRAPMSPGVVSSFADYSSLDVRLRVSRLLAETSRVDEFTREQVKDLVGDQRELGRVFSGSGDVFRVNRKIRGRLQREFNVYIGEHA